MKRNHLICLLLLAVLLLSGCAMKSTAATEVGVRTKKFALVGEKGVEDRIYPPGGTYFFIPFLNDWHTFDTKLQNLEMVIDAQRGDRKTRDDLLFKTVDGNDISLDVIVAYRINPEKAPYILQNVAANDQEVKEKILRTVARSRPRDIFGELKTEEFYVADYRQKKAEAAQKELSRILEPMGIIVERVLPKDYRFNPAYQKAIEGRKVADQQSEQNKSATRAAVEDYKRKVEDAKGEVNKMVARADGEFQQAKIEADAYFSRQKNIAEAIQVEGEAEAEGIRKMNEALVGTGGETMVKLRLAEALQGKSIMLLPMSEGGLNLKTTDINQLLTIKGLQAVGKQD
jgi:regulator of protease activity HflC (stomatin/prohibitin superfamily)